MTVTPEQRDIEAEAARDLKAEMRRDRMQLAAIERERELTGNEPEPETKQDEDQQ